MTDDNLKNEEEVDKLPPEDIVETKEKKAAVRFFESLGLFFLELIKVAVLAGVTIFFVRYFLFKPFYVKGQSMESNFFEHEYLIIDEISYRFRAPQRGEVVVFRAPATENNFAREDFYLKRVIGLPHERVKIEDGKVVIYNQENPQGIVLDEPYLDQDTLTNGAVNVSLGPDQYFVLGDNRDASFDSRGFGPIPATDIVGRTWFRGFPLNRISSFSTPAYNL